MLKAWLHNKLGRALGADSSNGIALNRAVRLRLVDSEDALTSSVMGAISYLPADLAWRVLVGARPVPIQSPPWEQSAPQGAPSWEFWPSLDPADGDGGTRVEPDVLLRWGATNIVFEAKHRGTHTQHQWGRQLRALLREEGVTEQGLRFVALGGWKPGDDHARAAAVRADDRLAPVPIYRLHWRDLNRSLSEACTDQLDPGLQRLLEDAITVLDGAGFHLERGMWTLPAVAAGLGTLTAPASGLPFLGGET